MDGQSVSGDNSTGKTYGAIAKHLMDVAKERGLLEPIAKALGKGFLRVVGKRHLNQLESITLANRVAHALLRPVSCDEDVALWEILVDQYAKQPSSSQMRLSLTTLLPTPREPYRKTEVPIVDLCPNCGRLIWKSDGGNCPKCAKDSRKPERLQRPVGMEVRCQKCSYPVDVSDDKGYCPECRSSWSSADN